jgi:hypothetical protein
MLDTRSFPSFKPFLEATYSYALQKGFRFKLIDWSVDCNNRDIVDNYIALVREGEEAVLQDVARAAKIAEQGGLRNVMIATCKELELWPPSSPDRLQSVAYTDMSEPMESIAWALYNYEKILDESKAVRQSHDILAQTASYIVDFAQAAGERMEISPSGSQMLMGFLERAKEYTDTHRGKRASVKRTILERLGDFADESYISDIEVWLDRHYEAVAVGTIALVAGLALAALALHSRNKS